MLMAVKKSVTPKPAARSARRSRAAEAGASTRDVLIREAMKLFAERAIDAVSLREIVQKAGQGNQSAIHYHFNDKQGLVIAVAEFVRAMFEPYFAAALGEIVRLERDGALRDEDLVAGLVMPLIQVFHADDTGRDAIRFVARLASDGGDLGQSLVLQQCAPFLNEIEPRLAARHPGKQREKLQFQMLLGMSSTIFGLTAIGGLRHSPFGGNHATLYAGRFDDLIRDYVHFVGRGLLGD